MSGPLCISSCIHRAVYDTLDALPLALALGLGPPGLRRTVGLPSRMVRVQHGDSLGDGNGRYIAVRHTCMHCSVRIHACIVRFADFTLPAPCRLALSLPRCRAQGCPVRLQVRLRSSGGRPDSCKPASTCSIHPTPPYLCDPPHPICVISPPGIALFHALTWVGALAIVGWGATGRPGPANTAGAPGRRVRPQPSSLLSGRLGRLLRVFPFADLLIAIGVCSHNFTQCIINVYEAK